MKDDVALFFDSVALTWDSTNIIDTDILEKITDIAGVTDNKTVLDVGCGTGVLFPFLLKRNVRHITALDISEKMLLLAQRKFPDERITFIRSDISSFCCDEKFDCVTVHNTFPHFMRQREALERLISLTACGGRLTVAHSISRDAVLKCHENIPEVSLELPEANVLADMFGNGFANFTVISDEKCYIVSAEKKSEV